MNSHEKTIITRLIYLILIVIATGALITVVAMLNSDASYPYIITLADPLEPDAASDSISAVAAPEDAYESIILRFAGSCTVGSLLGSDTYGTFNAALAENGSGYFLENLSKMLTSSDLTVAGCASVISDEVMANDELRSGVLGDKYLSGAAAAEIFTSGGIDALSLEFGRTNAFGSIGYSGTKDTLTGAGLDYADAGKALYLEKAGIRIGVYCRSITDETSAESIRSWLSTAVEKNDYLILYLSEQSDDDHGSYLPDEEKKAMFRSFVDSGADIVVGTNGACIQPYERYGKGCIVYSLGALIDGSSKYPDPYTMLLRVELRAVDGKIDDAAYSLTPCRTYTDSDSWKPSILEASAEYDSVRDFMRGAKPSPTSN